jgi:hypothetical protein
LMLNVPPSSWAAASSAPTPTPRRTSVTVNAVLMPSMNRACSRSCPGISCSRRSAPCSAESCGCPTFRVVGAAKSADRAIYRAETNGRNRAEIELGSVPESQRFASAAADGQTPALLARAD